MRFTVYDSLDAIHWTQFTLRDLLYVIRYICDLRYTRFVIYAICVLSIYTICVIGVWIDANLQRTFRVYQLI
jgi:hypothetical protein